MSSLVSSDSASRLDSGLGTHAPASGAALARRYTQVRAFSERICAPLVTEDYGLQAMPDVSPAKWHLAHTTWFFETFVLEVFVSGYQAFHPDFVVLYNSYYNAVGEQFTRAHRGFLSRPTVEQVHAYRAHVDEALRQLLESADVELVAEMSPVMEIGLQHEQQHQELMLTDLKYNFSVNPLHPVYRAGGEADAGAAIDEGVAQGISAAPAWRRFEAGLQVVGHAGPEAGFAFDNEQPRHRVFLERFELATRLVTAGEYLAFMQDGGYQRPELWLSEGWSSVLSEGWTAPLYWRRLDGVWQQFTLSGLRPVDPSEPVCHVSLFEADAFARWSGARLPTEFEWEAAAQTAPIEGNFADDLIYHPVPLASGDASSRVDSDALKGREASDGTDAAEASSQSPDSPHAIHQLFGDVWEWTSSSYGPYPGYAPPDGALGEYNGKFMYNQYVLRGGSCATSRDHIRASYRNFFPGHARWQFMGIRLARSVSGDPV